MITNVLEFLEKSAQRFPEKIALRDTESSVSYETALAYSRDFAIELLELIGESREPRPVLVFIDKRIYTPLTFFGIMYSGNFYVPVDASLPKARLQYFIDFIEPAAIVLNELEEMNELTFHGPCIHKEKMVYEKDESLKNNALEAYPKLFKIRQKHLDEYPAYAMFTSGTTGVPKGVLIRHKSIINLAFQFTDSFQLDEKMIVGNQAPFDFDVSTKDLYLSIKNGGELCLIPKSMFSFPMKLVEFLNNYEINTAIWATSVLRTLSLLKTFDTRKPEKLSLLMFSGEVMQVKHMNYLRDNLQECRFVNLYGPTEITCNCTYYEVNRDFKEDEQIPIGKAFKNTEIIILDEEDRVTDGLGEICVGGTSLALGYYKNPEQTAKVFVQNPINLNYPERIYRTGDYGFYNELGQLMFMGRKDHQIKHLGHRIELEEIERILNKLESIDIACCLYHKKKERIFLFYQAPEEMNKVLIQEIKKVLPIYMQPKKLIHFEALPLNKNAKIDRKGLEAEYML